MIFDDVIYVILNLMTNLRLYNVDIREKFKKD